MDGVLTISAHDFEFIRREPGLPDQEHAVTFWFIEWPPG
jgi:hypothetical protein